MAGQSKWGNQRGVSESIGFLLILTIMITGIGLVTLYGYPMLMKQQISADEKIMEKNMIVLQNDIKSLAYKTVPNKETSLKIGGGLLFAYNSSHSPSSSTLSLSDDSGTTYVDSFQSGELRYESVSAQTDISLQNGAVILRPWVNQEDVRGSVMLAEPRWFYDKTTNTMVIYLINITSDSLLAKDGISTVRMKLGETGYNESVVDGGRPLHLEYTPDPGQDYSVAWDNYFMKILDNPPAISVLRSGEPGTGMPLTYTITPSTPLKLVIKQYEIKTDFI
ncbi:MAG: hypothetical protein WC586_07700 [Methanoregula sp.]